MSLKTFSLAILVASLLPLPSNAALIISEVCFNEPGSTADGEWIEIFNDTPSAIDLSNYKIGDEEQNGGTSATEAMFQFPAGASIGPGQVQIISGGATRFFAVYGFNPTYETSPTDAAVPDMAIYSAWDPDGGILNMSNSNDQAVLVDATDGIIDAASWGNTFAFNPGVDITGNVDGQSILRPNPYSDTNTAADWTLGPNPAGSTNAQRSTPGTVPAPVPEPASAVLAIAFALAGACIHRR
jgi:hypothetical protein